jgi:glycosyltransferase involved in cell wall biosynthesis
MIIPASVAIRSSYYHHAQNAGYKQILRYTLPKAIFGIDEHSKEHLGSIYGKYLFLNEWKASNFIKRNPEIKLLHILYGEEYYRFSARLVKVPIVVTYHQPPEILQQEISEGNYMGKVYAWAHQLNKNRFKKMAAAIVMTEAQKDVLAAVVPSTKIHVLPLGADLKSLTEHARKINTEKQSNQILTVGEWQRDWEFYFNFLAYCQQFHPQWKFVLVNRKLQNEYRKNIDRYKNLTFYDGVDDTLLYTLYKSSISQFLPFKSAAGNNSLNESLAFGCPVVTNILGTKYRNETEIIDVCRVYNNESMAASCSKFLNTTNENLIKIAELANDSVSDFDWENIAKKTIEIYNSVI